MKSVAARQVGGTTEALVVFGMDIYRYHIDDAYVRAGLTINSSEFARSNLSFSDVISISSSSSETQFLLSSAPNGDDTLYHLDLSASTRYTNGSSISSVSWVSEVETRGWQGRIASINKAIDDSSAISK